MKALWYCTKNKPYLLYEPSIDKNKPCRLLRKNLDKTIYNCIKENAVNGKIVAESDYEVEEVTYVDNVFKENYHTKTLDFNELIKRSRLTIDDLVKYLGMGDFIEKIGYAIHIKNLEIFDKPKELKDLYIKGAYHNAEKMFTDEIQIDGEWFHPMERAPQNMCYAQDIFGNKYVVISVHPEWLCLILNGLKTIEVRRKVLKEMKECLNRE